METSTIVIIVIVIIIIIIIVFAAKNSNKNSNKQEKVKLTLTRSQFDDSIKIIENWLKNLDHDTKFIEDITRRIVAEGGELDPKQKQTQEEWTKIANKIMHAKVMELMRSSEVIKELKEKMKLHLNENQAEIVIKNFTDFIEKRFNTKN